MGKLLLLAQLIRACVFFIPFFSITQVALGQTQLLSAANFQKPSPTNPDPHSGSESAPQGSTTTEKIQLFLHTDKTVYEAGETLWFTGYILNRDESVMERQHALYILITDAISRRPAIRQKFLIESGIGRGSVFLPDSLEDGEYWLLAYTNDHLERQGQPLFRQLISLRSVAVSPFRILSQSNEVVAADSIHIHCKIGTAYGGLASGGKFIYTVFANRDSLSGGALSIDDFGEVIVPAKRLAGKKLEITATVTRDNLRKCFILSVASGTQTDSVQNTNIDPASVDQHLSAKVTLVIDSSEYHKRSHVILHVRVTDAQGQPLRGMFSLSVASTRKTDPARTGNIIHYTELRDSAAVATLEGIAEAHLHPPGSGASDSGFVLYKGKTPKEPVSLALVGSGLMTFQTDPNGRFLLPFTSLIAPTGATTYISVINQSAEQYKITIHDRSDEMDRRLATLHYPLNFNQSVTIVDSDELKLQSDLGLLKAALVKTKIPTNPSGPGSGRRGCDIDYVCTHDHGPRPYDHILNCPYVKSEPCETTKPVEGQAYMYRGRDPRFTPAATAGLWNYHCDAPAIPGFLIPLEPIQRPVSFTVPDYDGHNPLSNAGSLQSTLYWQHLLSTRDKGELNVYFYTNDVTGKFTCTLQGLSVEGPIFGQASFVVTP